jgi:hypothetical protein
MRTAKYPVVSAALLIVGMQASVYAETPNEIRTRILMQTKFNYVPIESLSVPISEYKGDGDPATLEFIIFSKESDGPSRVSDDGEVIFFYEKDSKQRQQQLIQKAFEIRIAKAIRGT